MKQESCLVLLSAANLAAPMCVLLLQIYNFGNISQGRKLFKGRTCHKLKIEIICQVLFVHYTSSEVPRTLYHN
jgi:hypothetical protein